MDFLAKLNPVEVAAAATAFLCVWLYTRQNVWSWPITIVSATLYSIVFFQTLILSPGHRLLLASGLDEGLIPALSKSTVHLGDLQRSHILQIVEECGWKIRGKGNAAERLGINPSTLRSRMQKLGIERPR